MTRKRQVAYLCPPPAALTSLLLVFSCSSSNVPSAHIRPRLDLSHNPKIFLPCSRIRPEQQPDQHQSPKQQEMCGLFSHQHSQPLIRDRSLTSHSQYYTRQESTYRWIPTIVLLSQICSCSFSKTICSSRSSCVTCQCTSPTTGSKKGGRPKIAIAPPVLVKTPQPVMFCFMRVFLMADTVSPTAPVIKVDSMARPTASFGWYTASFSDDIMSYHLPHAFRPPDAYVFAVIEPPEN